MGVGVRVVAGVCVVLIVAMIVLFVVSTREMGLLAGLRHVAGTWWGVTTLADLGVGLVFMSAWICLLERRPWTRPLWVVAMFLLGNFTTLVYVLVRCRGAKTVHELFLGRSAGDGAIE